MSKGNRKAFETFILEFMGDLTKGGYNRKVYEGLFSKMNDKQLEDFVVGLENGGRLSIWVSNTNPKEGLNWKNLLKLSKKYGFEPEQQLIYVDSDTGVKTITPTKFIVGTAEVRKQRQMLIKKIGYSKDDTKIDDLTGQVIGDSRGAGLSDPEIGVLMGLGLPKTVHELYNVKGGDLGALKAYKNELITTGKTTTMGSMSQGTGVKSLKYVASIFRGRMLDNNLGD